MSASRFSFTKVHPAAAKQMVADKQNDLVRRTAISILTYFRTHPHAQDSSSGISQWWVHEEVMTVGKALELLIQEGVIEKDGKLYRLKRNRSGSKANGSIL